MPETETGSGRMPEFRGKRKNRQYHPFSPRPETEPETGRIPEECRKSDFEWAIFLVVPYLFLFAYVFWLKNGSEHMK